MTKHQPDPAAPIHCDSQATSLNHAATETVDPNRLDKEMHGGFPVLMTESELVEFLCIPMISNARDHRNVIENLKRLRKLPRIHICNKALYPMEAVLKWIEQETTTGN